MIKLLNKFKKLRFWPIFGPFYHHAKIQKKLIIQFQENAPANERMEGKTDGRMGPFIRPFRLLPRLQNAYQTQNIHNKSYLKFLKEYPQSEIFSLALLHPHAKELGQLKTQLRAVSRICKQRPFFANTLFWVSGDNLGLKHPVNPYK